MHLRMYNCIYQTTLREFSWWMLQDDSHFLLQSNFHRILPTFHSSSSSSSFLVQTAHIISGHVSLRLAHNVYASTNKTKIIQIKVELSFYLLIFMCVLQCHVASSLCAQMLANVMKGADSVRLVGVISGLHSVFQSFSEDSLLYPDRKVNVNVCDVHSCWCVRRVRRIALLKVKFLLLVFLFFFSSVYISTLNYYV